MSGSEMTRVIRFFLGLVLFCMLAGMGCGKKAPPLPPEYNAGVSVLGIELKD